jgi:hypothetical protein
VCCDFCCSGLLPKPEKANLKACKAAVLRTLDDHKSMRESDLRFALEADHDEASINLAIRELRATGWINCPFPDPTVWRLGPEEIE